MRVVKFWCDGASGRIGDRGVLGLRFGGYVQTRGDWVKTMRETLYWDCVKRLSILMTNNLRTTSS